MTKQANSTAGVAVAIFTLLSNNPALAQQNTSLPTCSHTYLDADNDGYGWTGSESCLITDESEPAPVFTNQETGQQVELVRTYWDPNNDIAGRYIRCEGFTFDRETAVYEKDATDNFQIWCTTMNHSQR